MTTTGRNGTPEPAAPGADGTSSRAGWAVGGLGLVGAVGALMAIVVFDQPRIALAILVGLVAMGIVGLILWSVVTGPGPHGSPRRYVALAAGWVGGSALVGWVIGTWTAALIMSTAAAVPLIFAVRARRR